MKAIIRHTLYIPHLLTRLQLWLCLSLIVLATGPLQALNASRYASRSQLADGRWVKIAVSESGIHQITYRELSRWGFSNPAAVTIYGYGGAMLPETFSDDDPDDLEQIPSLNTGSKILFYAQGPVTWSYNAKTQEYDHETNTYSTAGYYFLTDSKSASAEEDGLAQAYATVDTGSSSVTAESQGYNTALMNCLNDGVPVGVFVKEAPGYRVLGLAYVEQYNSVTRMFSLHGPISTATESAGSFVPHGFEELPENEQKILMELDGQDERRVVTAQQVRREQQGRFREVLLRAYSETCAITGVNVPEVLQAAHINPYRGRKSQVVNNGILLRADLHLLYDAHLISVEPNSLSISLSGRMESTSYLRYNHQKLREPISADLGPNTDLLAVHYEQFRRENPVLVA